MKKDVGASPELTRALDTLMRETDTPKKRVTPPTGDQVFEAMQEMRSALDEIETFLSSEDTEAPVAALDRMDGAIITIKTGVLGL